MATEAGEGRQEQALTPKEITSRVSQLEEDVNASLLQNPNYLKSAGKNLLDTKGHHHPSALWTQDGVTYEVTNGEEKDRKGRMKSATLTINIGGQADIDWGPDFVKIIHTFIKGRPAEAHIEVNSRSGGNSKDTEQAFTDARFVLRDLLPAVVQSENM